jgi:hypothetical protein
MLESIIIILLIIAVIMLVLTVEWQSLAIGAIDVILWFILGISIFSVEIPYQYTQGNTVFTGTQSLESMHPLGYLFIGIGFVMVIYLWVAVVTPMIKERKYKSRML